MPIGVVGYLAILQGATYVYESLFGKIQPSTESDASPSTDDDNDSEEFANQTAKNESSRQNAERGKSLAVGIASLESKLGEENSQDSSTGLVNVTTGASLPSDPVEKTCQTSINAVAIRKHQVTSESKDQPKKNSSQLEHSQTNAGKRGVKKGEPNKASSDHAENSVPITSRKKQPKKLAYHKDQVTMSEVGASIVEDKGKESAATSSSKEQTKEVSTQKDQVQTCEYVVGKEGSKGKELKKPTCNARKALSTTSSKEQSKKGSAKKDQRQASEDVAGKSGGKRKEPKKHACGSAKVPTTSHKEQPKKQSTKKNQGSTGEAGTSKAESKGMESKRPSSSNNAQDIVPTTSTKKQPKQVSMQKDQGSTCEYVVDKEGNKGKGLKKASCGNGRKTLSTASSKEQPKKGSAEKDQRQATEDVAGKSGGKRKDPKKHTCGSAKVPTISNKEQPKKQSTKKDQGSTNEAGTSKAKGKVKEPQNPCSADNAQDLVPTTSCKEKPKQVPTQKDQGSTHEVTVDKKAGKGKDSKKPSSSTNYKKTVPSIASKEQAMKQSTSKDQGISCGAFVGKKGGKGKEANSSDSANVNVPTTLSNDWAKRESAQKNTLPIGKADANKKKSSRNERKELRFANDTKNVPTKSSKEQPKKESAPKVQDPTCKADGVTKECKAKGVKSDVVGKITTSVTLAKVVEQPCLPGGSKEVAEQSLNSIQDSDSEWTLVGKPNTTKHKENRKMGPSDECQEGSKKTPNGKRYSLMRAARKKTQPNPSAAKPSEPKSEGTDQKVEDLPKKKRPTRRAKKKPKKGKPKPNAVATAQEGTSPDFPQEQCQTNKVETPTAVMNTWANVVKSKPNINTLSAHSEKKAPESLDGKTKKETELVKSVTETQWNVPVIYKKCISSKKRALSIKQANSTVLSIIVEESLTDSAGSSTKQQIPSSPVKQEELQECTLDSFIPNFPVKLVEEREEESEKKSEVHLNANKPRTDSPITQEAEMEDVANVATPNEQEAKGSSQQSADLHDINSPITKEADMKDFTGSSPEQLIPSFPVKQEELQEYMLDSFIPNFPVKLVEEREEENEKKSEEHLHANKPRTDSPITQEAEMKDVANVATPDEQEVRGPSQYPVNQPNINSPITKEADIQGSAGHGTKQPIPSSSIRQEELQEYMLNSFIPNFPVKLIEENEEEDEKKPEEHHNAALPIKQNEKVKIIPAMSESCEHGGLTDQAASMKILTSNATQTDEHVSRAVKTKAAAPVQRGPTDNMLTVKPEVQKSVPVRSVQDRPNNKPSKLSAFSPAFVPNTVAPAMQQRSNTIPADNSQTTLVTYIDEPAIMAANLRMQKSVPVRYPQKVSTTELSHMSAVIPAYAPYPAAPMMQQQGNTIPAINPQTTMVAYMYDPATLAANSVMTAAPVQHGPTDNMLTVKSEVHKSVPVRYPQQMPTMIPPQMSAFSPSYVPYPAAPMVLQHGNISPAVNPQVDTTLITCASGPATPQPGHTYYQNYNYLVPTTNTEMGYASTPYNVYTTCAPAQQQTIMPSIVEPNMQTRYPVVPLGKPQQVFVGNVKYQPAMRPVGFKQDVQRTPQVICPRVEPTTRVRREATIPSATCIPKAAASQIQQHANIVPAIKEVQKTVQEKSLKIGPTTTATKDQVTSPKIVLTTNEPHVIATSTATNTPKAIAPFKHQQSNNTLAVEEVIQKKDQVASPKVGLTTNEPQDIATPTATNTPKAAEPLEHQQSNNTLAVEEVVQEKDQVASGNVVLTTNATQEMATPTASDTPKAAAPFKHQQPNIIPVAEEVVQIKDQVTSPKVVRATNTPQEEASPVASVNATKAVVTTNQQPNNTCHPLSEFCTSSQAVRPKERGSLAPIPSRETVETSATDETGSTSKASKISRSTKRRRARARQRERQRAAEAEKKPANAEWGAVGGPLATVVEETEGADSSNHGEVASSSSSEIILNFDDDSEFVIDWEAEAAKPFYNSTEIFPPRVEIPEWAQWDFSQNASNN